MYTSTENAIQNLYSERAERDVFPAQLPQKRHHPIEAVDQSERYAPAAVGRNRLYGTSESTYPPTGKAYRRASGGTVKEWFPAAPSLLSFEKEEPRHERAAPFFEEQTYPAARKRLPLQRMAFASRANGLPAEKEKRLPDNKELFAGSKEFFPEKETFPTGNEKFMEENEEFLDTNEKFLEKKEELLNGNEEFLDTNEELLLENEHPLSAKEEPGPENGKPPVTRRSVRPKRTALFSGGMSSEAATPKKERKGLRLQLGIATLLVTAGLTLLYLGFWLPPEGEIHSSVLVAFGETSTFAGALFGVDYQYRSRRGREG